MEAGPGIQRLPGTMGERRGHPLRWERAQGDLAAGRRRSLSWSPADFPGAGVFVGRDKLASCWRAHELGFTAAVLDDAFQHRRLERDVDIVLFDPCEKLALRESASSLRRAGIILVKDKARTGDRWRSLKASFPSAAVFYYRTTPKGFVSLRDGETGAPGFVPRQEYPGLLRNRESIEVFEPPSASSGPRSRTSHVFPDHYPYPARSLDKIARIFAASGVEALVTTEKDAVKIVPAGTALERLPLYALRIGLDIEAGFFDLVEAAPQESGRRPGGSGMRTWAEYLAFLALKSFFFLLPVPGAWLSAAILGTLAFHLDGRRRRIALGNLEDGLRREKRPAGAPDDRQGLFPELRPDYGGHLQALPLRSGKDRGARHRGGLGEPDERHPPRQRGPRLFRPRWELGAGFAHDLEGREAQRRRPGPGQQAHGRGAREVPDTAWAPRSSTSRRPRARSSRPSGTGEVVAILIDQNVLRGQAVFVDFFGRPAGHDAGPGRFRPQDGRPSHPGLLPSDRFRPLPPEDPSSAQPSILDGDIETNVLKITRTCTKMIENEIRENPGGLALVS